MRLSNLLKVSLFGLAFFVSGCGGSASEQMSTVTWLGRHGLVESEEILNSGSLTLTMETDREMGWPGSGIAFKYEGNFATVSIEDSGRGLMDLTVNGEDSVVALKSGRHSYTIGNGEFGLYDVRLTRRSEFYDTGYFKIRKPIPVTAGGTSGRGLIEQEILKRKILFLGDSITAGFGVAGDTKDCANTPALHSPTQSYAMLAADGLNAEPQLIAISGRGVVHNWDGNPAPVMPAQLDYALPDRPETKWDHSQFMPDVVVTLLGTNDWSVIDPGRDKFRAGYRDMLTGIRERFPNAHIVTVSGPLLGGDQGAAIRDGIDWAMSDLSDSNISTVDLKLVDYGYRWSCNAHPGRTSMKVMANDLMAHLKDVKGWDYTRIDMVPGITPPAILPEGGVKHFDRRVAEIDLLNPLKGGTLLIGDSITEGWRDTPYRLGLLPENHANHGVGWDTSSGVLNRFPQISENKPDRIFIKIGTNDLSLGRKPKAIAEDVDTLISELQATNPTADIYLQSVLPREREKLADISKLNLLYADLATKNQINFIDLTSTFEGNDGTLRQDLTYDGLHLTDAGYKVWADALEPYLNPEDE